MSEVSQKFGEDRLNTVYNPTIEFLYVFPMSEGVVRVFNFPREKIILLLIHLESPYYNGGKVVKHDEGKDFVDVTFENSTGNYEFSYFTFDFNFKSPNCRYL